MRRAQLLLSKVQVPSGCALAITGSLARGEMSLHSDIDVSLIIPEEQGSDFDQGQLEQLWYPLWDGSFRVDHSVRTPSQCLALATEDPLVALSLLDVRTVAGDAAVVARTRESVLNRWRVDVARNLAAIVDVAISRWRRSGSVVAMTRPDIKNGRGGLRDIEMLRALSLGHVCDMPDVEHQRALLLDVRTWLHEAARRRRDILDPEFAVDVAEHLGFVDRYELTAAVADAGRTIDDALNTALGIARAAHSRNSPRSSLRTPLDVDVVDDRGVVTLARNPRLSDPALVLRVAAAAARTRQPIAEPSLRNLARHHMPLPQPWPRAVATDFFSVLSNPSTIEALDKHGLWEPLVPEWAGIRGLMPREPSHAHTIDHHTIVTLQAAAQRSVHVARPDLLLLAALFHDIGKGQGRPHEVVGAEAVGRMARRLALAPRDVSIVQTLVAEHTLLARLANRADPTAESTVDAVCSAVHYDRLTLDLLEALAEADARSTGPGVWSRSLANSVRTVCSLARARLSDLHPTKPFVAAPATSADFPKVTWRGAYLRESVRMLALLAAHGHNIESAKLINDAAGARAEFMVRPTTTSPPAEQEFLQAYKSGVFSMLPELKPALVSTTWYGNTVEVRTLDQKAAFGALLGVLPDVSWATMERTGATMIARFHLGNCDRARVEKDVQRAFGGVA